MASETLHPVMADALAPFLARVVHQAPDVAAPALDAIKRELDSVWSKVFDAYKEAADAGDAATARRLWRAHMAVNDATCEFIEIHRAKAICGAA